MPRDDQCGPVHWLDQCSGRWRSLTGCASEHPAAHLVGPFGSDALTEVERSYVQGVFFVLLVNRRGGPENPSQVKHDAR